MLQHNATHDGEVESMMLLIEIPGIPENMTLHLCFSFIMQTGQCLGTALNRHTILSFGNLTSNTNNTKLNVPSCIVCTLYLNHNFNQQWIDSNVQ